MPEPGSTEGQEGDLRQVDFEELKRQNTEVLIADQKSSLRNIFL